MVRGLGEMRWLVLVKHSLPDVPSTVDSADWQLTVEGVRQCGPLAEALYVASRSGGAAYNLWRRLQILSYVVLALPTLSVEQGE